MKTPDFWRRITQVLPELLLDSSALGNIITNMKLFIKHKAFISFRSM
jgi:hypothetical protein